MKKREEIDYNIGVDIGTASVGWAVTDMNDNIIKFNGKNMLGTRLFEPAETAAKRRIQRGTRRLIVRKKNRIKILRELLEEEINKVDAKFYEKLKESFLVKEDKTIEGLDMVFKNDFPNYYKDEKTKTIYHLRKELIENKEKQDIRLIYLALHHMLKHRGHFLNAGLDYDKGDAVDNDIKSTIDEIIHELNELNGAEELSNNAIVAKSDDILKVLVDKNLNRGRKKEALKDLICTKDNKEQAESFINAILGYKANFNKLLMMEEGTEKIEISLEKENAEDEAIEKVPSNINIFELLQKIYSYVILQKVLGDEKYLSKAMFNKYEKHGEDLKVLKEIYKKYITEEYANMFKKLANDEGTVIINYANYRERASLTTREALYKRIKKELKDKEEIICADTNGNKLYNYIVKSIDDEDFLLRQSSKDNAAIPIQLHKAEMIAIIKNQSKYYDVLKENEEKLVQLLEFRIPYYVGPLNNNGQGIAWAKRKVEGVRIYPWNFDEVIDKEATAEDFIRRMTNKCSYLLEEDVLPKKSLLYSEYEVLNEINKIRVNGELIFDNSIKLRIVDEVFRKTKNVKVTTLKRWIINNQIPIKSTLHKHIKDIVIEGMQKEDEFASSLTSYIDFTNIFGEIDDNKKEMIEELINWLTIFNDKEILIKKIKNKYPELETKQVEKILKLKYAGWGRLSEKLLKGITIVDKKNNRITIIEQLRRTNMNFMQIINDKELGFDKEIEKNSKKEKRDKISYTPDISELQGSPAIKRGIWQTVQIVEEIVKIMKHAPKNIYIEFAREEQEKGKRTISRTDKLLKIYKKIKNENGDYYKNCYQELKNKEDEKNKLNSEMLFLYFIQNGKCMYSGETLDIDLLSSSCEVDHIIPQAYIKDDSIENKALVLKEKNQEKMNNLVVPEHMRQGQRAMWESLLKVGLIGAKKYKNLTRATFDENDFKGFINRQLVETRQITKHVAKLLEEVYADTSIITIRADLTSNFRWQFNLYKSRLINDYHHAHDAYLATVIGHYIDGRYPSLRKETEYGSFIKIAKDKSYVKQNGYGFIVSSMNRNYESKVNDFVWDKDKKIGQVRKILDYKDCLVTKKLKENTGEFYNQTVYPSEANARKMGITKSVKKTENLLSRKADLSASKYGGYSGKNPAYLVAIEYTKGKKIVKAMIAVPIYVAIMIKEKGEVEEYLRKEVDCKDIRILRDKILMYQLIELNGQLVYITGDGEEQNAKQFFIKEDYKELFYKIEHNYKNIDEKEIYGFYKYYVEKVKDNYPLLQTETKALEEAKEDVEKLEKDNIIKIIKEIIKITQVNSSRAKMEGLNIPNVPKEIGRLSKKINLDKTVFIDQSITGLYEMRTRL